MRSDPKRAAAKQPEPKRPEQPESVEAEAILVPHVLKFSLCCPDSPYFRLTQPERKAIEDEFVAQLVAIFPQKVRDEWALLEFPLMFIGPNGQEILLQPDTIDEQREYLRLYFEFKMRDLVPPVKQPPGMPSGSTRFTVEDTPDDPCVMCITGRNEHVCVRCVPIELDGNSYKLKKDTRLGLVEAQVSVQLAWGQPLESMHT